jgi:hypothetical protein
MGKERQSNREAKKKPAKTLTEKRAAKKPKSKSSVAFRYRRADHRVERAERDRGKRKDALAF